MNRFRSIVLAAVFAGVVSLTAASAQTISVVSGNGQVLGQSANLNLSPLVVKVVDANGNPVPGATINWNASAIFGNFFLATGTNQWTSTTDSNGVSQAYGNLTASSGPGANFLSAYVQTLVTANVNGGNTITFTETQLTGAANSFVTPFLLGSLDNPAVVQQATESGDIFSGSVGTQGSRVIQVFVYATNGQTQNPVPGVAVQLLNFQDPTQGPGVQCVPQSNDPNALAGGFGTVLSNAAGLATCVVLYGGQPNKSGQQGQFVVTAGSFLTQPGGSGVLPPPVIQSSAGFWQYGPNDENHPTQDPAPWHGPVLYEKVTPGAVGSLKKIAGDGQSANPGQPVPTPLQVQVLSTSGQPLSGDNVTWTVTPNNGAVLSTTSAPTDLNGNASTSVTLSGPASGTVTVTATEASSGKSVSFSITAIPQIVITGFSIFSGNNQSAAINTPFAQPLVVQLTTNAGSPNGTTVQFSSTGPVILSATTATTDSNGRAQVNVTAGDASGGANVQASIAGASPVTFTLTVTPPAPTIGAGNFVNGADLAPNSLSPCGLGALVGGSLGAASVGPAFPGLPLPNPNVNITFSNITAPILGIGTTASGQQQITFQVPCNVTPSSSVPVVVAVGPGSTPVNLAVGAVSPGVFQTRMSDGVYRAVLVRPDGSYVSLQNPARRGETEIAFVTGLGATSPPVGTDALPIPGTPAAVQATVVPGMAGQAIPLVYAQLSEDLPGVYLVAFQIPTSMSTGNNVNFSIGAQVSGGATVYSGLTTVPVQ